LGNTLFKDVTLTSGPIGFAAISFSKKERRLGKLRVVPKYIAIELSHPIKAVASDLIQLRWKKYALAADFIIPDDSSIALRVEFDRVDVIRLLDEMPISTEHEETPNEGLIANHFAYVVQGASFWNQQSEAFKANLTTATHYRFITGWTCLDVITTREPRFAVVPVVPPSEQG
jgi:hypothetical protein